MCPVESKGGKTDILKSTRCPTAQSWTPTFLIAPKHNNWAPICDAKAPMPTLRQHSMVPLFYTNQASVALCARTARTAREAPSFMDAALAFSEIHLFSAVDRIGDLHLAEHHQMLGEMTCRCHPPCFPTLEDIGGVFAQRAHSASYYGVYPGNSPENLPPLEACMSNSKVRNSNVSCSQNYPMSKTMQCRQ